MKQTKSKEMLNTDYVLKIQPSSVLVEYIEYVENKIGIDEIPMTFNEWATYQKENDYPIGYEIIEIA